MSGDSVGHGSRDREQRSVLCRPPDLNLPGWHTFPSINDHSTVELAQAFHQRTLYRRERHMMLMCEEKCSSAVPSPCPPGATKPRKTAANCCSWQPGTEKRCSPRSRSGRCSRSSSHPAPLRLGLAWEPGGAAAAAQLAVLICLHLWVAAYSSCCFCFPPGMCLHDFNCVWINVIV